MKFASNFWVDPTPFFCHCRKPLHLPATPWHHDSEFCTGERHKKQRFKGFQEEQLGLFSALIIPTAYREASRAFVPFFRISAHKCLRQTHIHQVSHWCHSTRRNPPDVQYTLQHLHTLSPRWIMWLQSMRKSTVFWAPFTDRRGERERGGGFNPAARVERLSAFKTSILIRLGLRSLSLPCLVLGD